MNLHWVYILGAIYLSTAFAKFVLVVPHVLRLSYLISRKRGGARGEIFGHIVIRVFSTMVLYSVFLWVPTFIAEKRSFFVCPPGRQVFRACLLIHKKLPGERVR